ncbi:MAG: DUF202 domain-containing protein [Cyanobacteria bacterium P01_E01_bin.45]
MPGDDRQREHQANERTFLAWVRTSVSFLGIGLALARFSLFVRQGSAVDTTANSSVSGDVTTFLGAAMVAIGITTIGLGLWEYNRAYRQIEADDYRPNRVLVWVVAIAILLLGVISLPLALWRAAASKPKPPDPPALSAPEEN